MGIVFVGIVFLVGALSKVAYEPLLAKEIQGFASGIFDGSSVWYFLSKLLIVYEAVLGLILMRYRKSRIAISIAIMTLLLFSLYLFSLDTDVENCGCFGSVVRMSPKMALVKNTILLVLCIFPFLSYTKTVYPRQKKVLFVRKGIMSIGIVFSITLLWFFAMPPSIKSEQADSSLKEAFFSHLSFKGGSFSHIPKGKALVLFASPTCDHCKEVGIQLAQEKKLPLFIVFIESEQNEIDTFFIKTALQNTPWTQIEPYIFFDYIAQSPPRLYLLKNGIPLWHKDANFFTKDLVINNFPLRAQ